MPSAIGIYGKYRLFVTFILFGLREADRQPNKGWHLTQILLKNISYRDIHFFSNFFG